MFVCWRAGAMLCCPSAKAMFNPGRFISEQQLTVWFSTPSTAALMKQLGALKPGAFPSLRWSLFCGEPLPDPLAGAWAAAAPNALVENLYGPTELTIACARHRWRPDDPAAELGIVPIGEAYPGMRALVVDETLAEVAPGETGELLMSGPQVALGYLGDPERTAAAFVHPPGRSERFYRTGDRVRRPTPGRPMTHLGRLDHQVKILGHRVELGEVEAALRQEPGVVGAVAIGWPKTDSGYAGIAAFVEGTAEARALAAALEARLPDYMRPKVLEVRERLPRNASGKFDRLALAAELARPRQESAA
jgi:acyl-coenzyme A synthetase/AMP-(fatty) acid ligase